MTYHHFTIEEREKIQELWWQRKSIRAIARVVRRSPSSVSRELQRNFPEERRVYAPRLAHARALLQRQSRGRKDRLKNSLVRNYVIIHLKLGWSPEQIAATCITATSVSISHEAIYQYVYAQVYQGGHGLLKPGHVDLRPYLARRRKRRMRQGLRKSYRIDKGPLPSIDARPMEVAERQIVGHWEDDLIVSRVTKDSLKTINKRVSGMVLIARTKDATMAETNRVVQARLGAIPERWRKTLTRDRGSENLGHEELETILGIQCFFAHAYSSWERGSNENLNGLIRRFFPKKTDFSMITDEEIRLVEHLLNTRPRKRLGWRTPYEVFYEHTGVALQC